ncbi:MAG: M20 metallopeptidase family protein [Symbiobacteriia bacterium]
MNWTLAAVQDAAAYGVEVRRQLHRHPELSFQEQETAAYIAGQLRDMGYEPEQGIGGVHSVKAVLHGGRPGRTIALRADIDALPIQEEAPVPFASENPGVMHACGHDMHTATLLATARALKPLAPDLAGAVVFIFQPAEEVPPGGAVELVRAGILEHPHVDAVFGLHVDPLLPAGEMSFGAGPVNAAPDSFDIVIRGRGGHGAAPHQGIDAVVVAAQAVGALQTIHSRMINPFEPLVITVGRFEAGTARNVIAAEARLEGTVRTTSPALRERVKGLIEQVVSGICASFGATFTMDYIFGYPVLVNDPAMTDLAREAAAAVLGSEAIGQAEPGMYGEDFAYYLQERPGCFGNLGVGVPGAKERYPCHNPRLVVADEEAMPVGVAYYLNLVTRFCS